MTYTPRARMENEKEESRENEKTGCIRILFLVRLISCVMFFRVANSQGNHFLRHFSWFFIPFDFYDRYFPMEFHSPGPVWLIDLREQIAQSILITKAESFKKIYTG